MCTLHPFRRTQSIHYASVHIEEPNASRGLRACPFMVPIVDKSPCATNSTWLLHDETYQLHLPKEYITKLTSCSILPFCTPHINSSKWASVLSFQQDGCPVVLCRMRQLWLHVRLYVQAGWLCLKPILACRRLCEQCHIITLVASVKNPGPVLIRQYHTVFDAAGILLLSWASSRTHWTEMGLQTWWTCERTVGESLH
jgi:hypothetical protein